MLKIKTAASVNNPRKIGLWRKPNRETPGYSCSGELWKGGPSIRFCFLAPAKGETDGELWLVQIQAYDAAKGESVDLKCTWATNSEGQLAFVEIEGRLVLNIEKIEEVAGGGQAGTSGKPRPHYDLTFTDMLPEVEIMEMIERRRRAGLVKKVQGSTKQTTQPTYRTPVTSSTSATSATTTPEVEAEKVPAAAQSNTSTTDASDDDIPF